MIDLLDAVLNWRLWAPLSRTALAFAVGVALWYAFVLGAFALADGARLLAREGRDGWLRRLRRALARRDSAFALEHDRDDAERAGDAAGVERWLDVVGTDVTQHSVERANRIVCSLIHLGRYREALAYGERWLGEAPSDGATPKDAEDGPFAEMNARSRWAHATLVAVNLAEAEYNLGSWAQARARLERLERDIVARRRAPTPPPALDAVPASDARRVRRLGLVVASARLVLGRWLDDLERLVAAGVGLQLAWVLAHEGAADDALALLDSELTGVPCAPPADGPKCKASALTQLFRAEAYFAACWVLLHRGEPEAALGALRRSRRHLRRAASERNALFLEARCLLALGRTEEALRSFERGASHHHRKQGGDGLLAWGDALMALGRDDAAAAAYALAVERDGESESAARATRRLTSMLARAALAPPGPEVAPGAPQPPPSIS